MQLWREAPGDHHHSDLCISYTSSCAIPGTALLHVTSQGHTAWATTCQKRKPGISPVASTSSEVLKGSEAPQAAPCGWNAGWSLSRHLRPVWDIMSNICHTRTDKKGEASMLHCASAQLQVWKGMLTAVWAASPTSWNLTNLETQFITLRNFSLCSLFVFFRGHFTIKGVIILFLSGKSQTFL